MRSVRDDQGAEPVEGAGKNRTTRPWTIRGLLLYYLATPAFAAVDLFFHLPVRVALPDGRLRVLYYVGAFGLGLLSYRKPEAAPWVGMGESAVNLTLLLAAVLLPVWSGPESLLTAGGTPGSELLLERVLNLALGGTVMVVSFYRSQAEIVEQLSR